MSLSTVFTFLSKAFAKISIAFSLFFVVLAASYYFGIISDMVFNILFIVILIMLLIDTAIKFILKQDETVALHRLEKIYIAENYELYREEIQKNKSTEQLKGESFAKDFAKELGTKVISTITRKSTETKEEKRARLEKELAELS